ncbi:MAG: hypothetical protein EA378_01630 [Phycisphaerales bacterium]|nr:MAG: hypothetical protein EA378_01630 [Phycisphaerales bacterium]
MRTGRKIAETIHFVALGVWLGAILTTGMGAAMLFPTVRDLAPSAPKFAEYTGEHWRIVAGHVGAGLFLNADVVQFVCAFVAIFTAGVSVILMGRNWRTLGTGGRMVLLSCALTAFSYGFFIHTPQANAHLVAYWQAAEAGDLETATAEQRAFAAMHPTSTTILGLTAFSVLGAMSVGLFSAMGPPAANRVVRQTNASPLETPSLARTPGRP